MGFLWVWGSAGVPLFFVLSGYLLFRPFCRAMRAGTPFDIRNFYIRRLFRIYPAYLLALAAYTAVRYAARLHPPSLYNIATHLLMVFNSTDQREFYGVNVAFWTLTIEMQFYFLLPLVTLAVYRILKRRPNLAIFSTPLIFLFLGVAWRAVELHEPMRLGIDGQPMVRVTSVFSFLDLFACGMFVAALGSAARVSERMGWRTACGITIAGSTLFLGINRWMARPGNDNWLTGTNFWFLWSSPVLLCAAVAAILFVVVGFDGFPSTLLATRPFVFVGEASYSVYLFHVLFQLALVKWLPLTNIGNPVLRHFAWGAISLTFTVVVATVIYRLVELPCIRFSDRFKSTGVSLPVHPTRGRSPMPTPGRMLSTRAEFMRWRVPAPEPVCADPDTSDGKG